MTTPIYDFVRRYAASDAVRMHMPGHKGKPVLGCEPFDLTEIDGADELFAPSGIIAESEANASRIFGSATYYSTEGSSLCIRAMLCTALQYAAEYDRAPVIYAARNAHKTFLTAAALLRFQIRWLPQRASESYLTASVDWEQAAKQFAQEPTVPCAVYLTSPDYLGNISDIHEAASFCHQRDMLLLVDNAHGAYLKFLEESLHPLDLGADICCDSAHKTLPVLTGGAYLHIAETMQEKLRKYAKTALSLFATTSPINLIMASLDKCNQYLDGQFREDLRNAVSNTALLSEQLQSKGWCLAGNEPLKLTICAKYCGYSGNALAEILQKHSIYVEFSDPDYVVLMPSAANNQADYQRVLCALQGIQQRNRMKEHPPEIKQPEIVMQPHEVLFAPSERLPISDCKGRICAEFAVSCPPAVPIVMSGERIGEDAISAMRYYGIKNCKVVK